LNRRPPSEQDAVRKSTVQILEHSAELVDMR